MKDRTTVTVDLTIIRYYLEGSNEIYEHRATGKLNVGESKKVIEGFNNGSKYIDKENIRKTFTVRTVDLLHLGSIE